MHKKVTSQMNSILETVKDYLGIHTEILVFDSTIKIHINTVFMVLNQIGVGPKDGMFITGMVETWDKYSPDELEQEIVKSYICMCVKIAFDPPTSSFVLTSMNNQIKELEWRLKTRSENKEV